MWGTVLNSPPVSRTDYGFVIYFRQKKCNFKKMSKPKKKLIIPHNESLEIWRKKKRKNKIRIQQPTNCEVLYSFLLCVCSILPYILSTSFPSCLRFFSPRSVYYTKPVTFLNSNYGFALCSKRVVRSPWQAQHNQPQSHYRISNTLQH